LVLSEKNLRSGLFSYRLSFSYASLNGALEKIRAESYSGSNRLPGERTPRNSARCFLSISGQLAEGRESLIRILMVGLGETEGTNIKLITQY